MKRGGEVRPLTELGTAPTALAAVEAIFFQSSNTQSFTSAEERHQFRERWLLRYIAAYPDDFLVAFDPVGAVAGYLAGCPEDAALLPAFADVAAYAAFLAECARYPAHLHVNVRVDARGHGIGRRLIVAFAAGCARRGIARLHVITARGAANGAFYERCGFQPVAERLVAGRALIMLGLDTGTGSAKAG